MRLNDTGPAAGPARLHRALSDRAWIQRHIPHQGRMCLLDEMLSWDEGVITCRSTSHRDLDNPLRSRGQLGIACGIEYAAQTMALHGALLASATAVAATAATAATAAVTAATTSPTMGFLAGVRGVEMHALRLDDLAEDMVCEARRVAGDGATALYEFELRTTALRLLSGRATVLLGDIGGLQP